MTYTTEGINQITTSRVLGVAPLYESEPAVWKTGETAKYSVSCVLEDLEDSYGSFSMSGNIPPLIPTLTPGVSIIRDPVTQDDYSLAVTYGTPAYPNIQYPGNVKQFVLRDMVIETDLNVDVIMCYEYYGGMPFYITLTPTGSGGVTGVIRNHLTNYSMFPSGLLVLTSGVYIRNYRYEFAIDPAAVFGNISLNPCSRKLVTADITCSPPQCLTVITF